MIFDTHAHYDDDKFIFDRDELLGRELRQAGIEYVMNVAADMQSVKTTIALADKYDNVYGALGVHPSGTEELTEMDMEFIRDAVMKETKIRAVGEIGLDYSEDEPSKETQEKWFRRQIRLAQECDKPVIVHSRDAAADTYRVIKECYEDRKDRINGVVHCFSYPIEEAEKYIKLGFMIGIGGVVTFKNGRKLREVAAGIPLECMVLETDCPYLAPEPHRGERNTSANLPFVAAAIAEIRGVGAEEIFRATMENAKKLYRIAEGK